MDRLIHILFEFGYVLIFAILVATTFFLHIPKEKGIENYKKARTTLGIAFAVMICYCIFRLIVPQFHGDYEDFWILVTVNFIISWLTYSSLLFLIETPRYLTRHFIIDGIIPTIIIMTIGVIGYFLVNLQQIATLIIGIVFGVKCIWMFIICIKEYNKCEKELDNYYDESPDIKWIRVLIFLSLIMSIATIIALYIPHPYVHLVYYASIPIIYTYMGIKVIDFAPRKIDNIRKNNLFLMEKESTEKKEKVNDLSSKIGPLVDKWVESKKYCKEGLTIKDVAMEMGTNHNYLSQYLNNKLNVTFQVWLNTLRIEESKLLLLSDEKISIEEIGIRVGIPQNYNFSRWFRVVTEMTPFQYKRTYSQRKQ